MELTTPETSGMLFAAGDERMNLIQDSCGEASAVYSNTCTTSSLLTTTSLQSSQTFKLQTSLFCHPESLSILLIPNATPAYRILLFAYT